MTILITCAVIYTISSIIGTAFVIAFFMGARGPRND